VSETDTQKIDRACNRLLIDPELRPLLLWWETTSLRARLPDGPVDASRLLMVQGDRERLLAVMERGRRYDEQQRKQPTP
jgi:hypothetical protein